MAVRGRPSPHYAGKIFGDLVLLQKVRTPAGANGGQRWRIECRAKNIDTGKICGNRFTAPIFYLVRDKSPKVHCGCRSKEGVNPFPREKGIWQMMNRRCYYDDHKFYKYYGGAGITVCEEWIETNPEGWNNFIRDMGPAGGMKFSLDRKNPFLNYTKENCRWATDVQQANNQKKHWLAVFKTPEACRAQGERLLP